MIGIYCRISGKKAVGKDVSIEDQQAQGILFAKELGLPYKVYKDIGISGAKDEIEDRPQFAEMFTDIKKKSITAVFVIDQSRIERNSRIWQLFSYAIVKYQCKYYVGGRLVDLDDDETRLSTGIISLTNEFFAKLTARKVKSANRLNASKGKGHGITAYGYKKDKDGYLVIDETQVETVRNIFKWSLEGIGSYTIAKKLNETGIPTKSAQFAKKYIVRTDKYTGRKIKYPRSKVPWRGNVVYDIITNPIHKGQRIYGDVIAEIEGTVSEELWDQVNNNLKQNKRKVGPKNKFKYLLNGIIFCADCGAEFRGKYRTSGRHKTYSCKGPSQGLSCKESRGLNIVALESFIIHHLFHSKDLYNKLSGLKVNESTLEIQKKKLKQLEANKNKLIKLKDHLYKLLKNPDLAKDEDITKDYVKAKNDMDSLFREIDEVQNTISNLSVTQRRARLDKIFGEFDYKMNFDQIKKAVHGLVQKIIVKHMPDQKLFLVQINYKGFDEQSVFAVTHQLNQWVNLSYYQVVPRTTDDKQMDNDLFDYFASTENYTRTQLTDVLKHFKAWEEEYESLDYPQLLDKVKHCSVKEEESVINLKTPNIKLNREEIYDFNSGTS